MNRNIDPVLLRPPPQQLFLLPWLKTRLRVVVLLRQLLLIPLYLTNRLHRVIKQHYLQNLNRILILKQPVQQLNRILIKLTQLTMLLNHYLLNQPHYLRSIHSNQTVLLLTNQLVLLLQKTRHLHLNPVHLPQTVTQVLVNLVLLLTLRSECRLLITRNLIEIGLKRST